MHSLTEWGQVKAMLGVFVASLVLLVVEACVMWEQGDYQGVFLMAAFIVGVLALVLLGIYDEVRHGDR